MHSRRRNTKSPTTKSEIASSHLQQIAADEDNLPRQPLRWVGMMILAAVVGSLTGLVGAGFRLLLEVLAVRRGLMIAWAHSHGLPSINWTLPAAFCAAGAALACY